VKGKLYIVPTFLSDADSNTILEGNKTVVNALTCFIVEDVKTARRHLRAMGYKKNFDEEVTFFEWDKHKGNPIHSWLEKCEQGFDVGSDERMRHTLHCRSGKLDCEGSASQKHSSGAYGWGELDFIGVDGEWV
jgi:hypothetical protein